MPYLELAPAITALRARPDEFEFSHDTLLHLPSRHRFGFRSEDDLQIHAACDCSFLSVRPEQAKEFHAAYREWHASYWRPLQINRDFAAHFEPPPLWRRAAIRLLKALLAWPQRPKAKALHTALPLEPVS